MKLFLYSTWQLSAPNREALGQLVGKDPSSITFAAIINAVDVVENADSWIGQSYGSVGSHIELVDLRQWQHDRAGLREKLASKDVIWVSAGNGFYLRWLLRKSGAEEVIRELVQQGQVYAAWGGGSVIAGPTLHFFEDEEEMKAAPTLVMDGLNLTELVVVPHMDMAEFSETMATINQNLKQAGYETVPLKEAQALVIDGDRHWVIGD